MSMLKICDGCLAILLFFYVFLLIWPNNLGEAETKITPINKKTFEIQR